MTELIAHFDSYRSVAQTILFRAIFVSIIVGGVAATVSAWAFASDQPGSTIYFDSITFALFLSIILGTVVGTVRPRATELVIVSFVGIAAVMIGADIVEVGMGGWDFARLGAFVGLVFLVIMFVVAMIIAADTLSDLIAAHDPTQDVDSTILELLAVLPLIAIPLFVWFDSYSARVLGLTVASVFSAQMALIIVSGVDNDDEPIDRTTRFYGAVFLITTILLAASLNGTPEASWGGLSISAPNAPDGWGEAGSSILVGLVSTSGALTITSLLIWIAGRVPEATKVRRYPREELIDTLMSIVWRLEAVDYLPSEPLKRELMSRLDYLAGLMEARTASILSFGSASDEWIRDEASDYAAGLRQLKQEIALGREADVARKLAGAIESLTSGSLAGLPRKKAPPIAASKQLARVVRTARRLGFVAVPFVAALALQWQEAPQEIVVSMFSTAGLLLVAAVSLWAAKSIQELPVPSFKR